MLVEGVDDRPHPVVVKLDRAIVETDQYPWPHWVEGQTLHSGTLGGKLRRNQGSRARKKTIRREGWLACEGKNGTAIERQGGCTANRAQSLLSKKQTNKNPRRQRTFSNMLPFQGLNGYCSRISVLGDGRTRRNKTRGKLKDATAASGDRRDAKEFYKT